MSNSFGSGWSMAVWTGHALRGGSIVLGLAAALAAGRAQAATPAEEGRGGPEEEVSVRLRAGQTRWGANQAPTLMLDLMNRGQRSLVAMQLQETGDLEVDGLWYKWLGAGVWTQSPFPPGRRYDGIPITLNPDWMHYWPQPNRAPNLRLGLSPGRHTVRFATTLSDPALAGKRLKAEAPMPRASISVTSNPVEIEMVASGTAPPPVAPWGEPVEGVAVLLACDHFAWTGEDAIALRASVKNQGQRELQAARAQESGELELDGLWYHWVGQADAKTSPLPPGSQFDGILVILTNHWQGPEGQPLELRQARHTVRFAVAAARSDHGQPSSPIRAVSNPVQINVSLGGSQLGALVAKVLPGWSLRVVRRQSGAQEKTAEVLVAPSGAETDLDDARHGLGGGWRGTATTLPPAGSFDRLGLGSGRAYNWHNPKLTALVPQWKLRITTAREAEEATRLIYGLFHGQGYLSNWSLRAEASEAGWLVTMTYVGPPAQVPYQGPMELIMEDGALRDVRQGGWGSSGPGSVPNDQADGSGPGWGEPVEGLSIRLQSDKPEWYSTEVLVFRLAVRNTGSETLYVASSQELGELEVDGVSYSWSEQYYVGRKPLPPGRSFINIALSPFSSWRRDGSQTPPGPGQHTIRYSMLARRGDAKQGQIIRAVSGPVQYELRMGVRPKPAATPGTGAPTVGTQPGQF